jgi:secondary thiamine-phosphate synthase enzyme
MRTTIKDQAGMKLRREVLQLRADHAPQFMDITSSVVTAVEASEVQEGTVTVFSRHTTAAVKINENEPLLLQDMAQFLDRFAPPDGEYQHNDFEIRTANMTDDECPNGHSHCQHLMLSASETIPIVDGKPVLGRWQSVFVIELDRPRDREIVIQVQGW